MKTETAIIQVNRLTKTFGRVQAVNEISFEVQPGELFALLGPNGAGKSTTLKILTTLLKPTAGSVTIDGHDPLKQAGQARRSFGVVFQDMSLDEDLTAAENLELHGVLYDLPKDLIQKRTEALFNMMDLWERRNSLVKEFSGGMKRRLEIARALLHAPKILFLDEPTLGLDPQTRSILWAYLRELNQADGTTIFFTTHYLEEAERLAQRAGVIDHGKLIALDTPEALKKQANSASLEEAFLALTGEAIRPELPSKSGHAMRFGH